MAKCEKCNKSVDGYPYTIIKGMNQGNPMNETENLPSKQIVCNKCLQEVEFRGYSEAMIP